MPNTEICPIFLFFVFVRYNTKGDEVISTQSLFIIIGENRPLYKQNAPIKGALFASEFNMLFKNKYKANIRRLAVFYLVAKISLSIQGKLRFFTI
jgi:hypothetical protein